MRPVFVEMPPKVVEASFHSSMAIFPSMTGAFGIGESLISVASDTAAAKDEAARKLANTGAFFHE